MTSSRLLRAPPEAPAIVAAARATPQVSYGPWPTDARGGGARRRGWSRGRGGLVLTSLTPEAVPRLGVSRGRTGGTPTVATGEIGTRRTWRAHAPSSPRRKGSATPHYQRWSRPAHPGPWDGSGRHSLREGDVAGPGAGRDRPAPGPAAGAGGCRPSVFLVGHQRTAQASPGPSCRPSKRRRRCVPSLQPATGRGNTSRGGMMGPWLVYRR